MLRRKKLKRLRRKRVQFLSRSYYGLLRKEVTLRIYKPYLGEGLPRTGIWRREGRYIYFRCSACSKINRNTVATFVTRRSPIITPVYKETKIRDVGILYRCIRCNHCGSPLSGTVLLGFRKPEAFLKKA